MVLTYTGTKGEPVATPSGAAPTFAADLTEIADWFQTGRAFRKLATQAALIAATGMDDNDLAQVDNIDGAWFKYDGTLPGWRMYGIAVFDTAAARTTAITTPADNMLTIRRDADYIEQYIGSDWVALVTGFGTWANYTPALTNMAIGTGGSANGVLEWRTEGDQVHVRGTLILGTSGQSVGTAPTVALPVTMAAISQPFQHMSGLASYYDVSAALGSTTGLVRGSNSSTTVVQLTTITPTTLTATSPFTWAAGDMLFLDFIYNPA